MLILGDHVGQDGGGKLNGLGIGFGIAAITQTGATAPQGLGVLIDFPRKYVGQTVELSLELVDLDANSAATVPGPSGRPEALRIVQSAEIPAPLTLPGLSLPADYPARVQLALSFANGLPLAQGRSYEWRLRIDGYHRKGWAARFYVVAAPSAPIFGGPGGPADIPNVVNPETLDDDLEPPPVAD